MGTMRALVCRRLGNPAAPFSESSALVETEVPVPCSNGTLPAGSVRIRIAAGSINFADALMVMGKYQERPKLPFIPGSEVSGTVIEVGKSVKDFSVGDRVCAVVTTGAYAEQVVCDASGVFHLPEGVDLEAAAGFPVAYGTAHLSLVHRAGLRSGQVLLVLGAAGGVGTAAVQIGKLLGATVIAAAKGSDKVALLRSMGADHVIDTGEAPGPSGGVKEGVRAFLQGRRNKKGVDVIFDPVGGKQFEDALKVAAWGAQIAIIGFASGEIPSIAANIALVKNITIHGIFWGSYMKNRPEVLRGSMDELLEWLTGGKLRIHISVRAPLSQANTAFGALLGRKVMGKAILTISEATTLSRL